MSYQAIVVHLKNVRKHYNADRLQIATVYGSQIIIGLDNYEDQKGIYFPTDGCLSEILCKENDLIGYKDPETGERKGGYFDEKRRVRTQKFRGEKSDGFWLPMESLSFTGYTLDKLKEGDQFDNLNGIELCKKYIPKRNRIAGSPSNKKKKIRKQYPMFHEHLDTAQIAYNLNRIEHELKGAIVTCSEKVHGCVDKDTIINTLELGDVSIEFLIKNKKKLHIKTLNIITNEIEYEEIGAFFYKDNTDNWYEIELIDGKKIIITGDNPVWLPILKCYREVKYLKEGDYVLASKS